MKGLLRICLVLVVTVILVAGVLVMGDIFSVSDAQAAKPQGCPRGQEKQSGCKYVRNMNTGDCGWLPDQAVASPWEEIPAGTCGQKKTTPTHVVVVKATITSTSCPTSTAMPGEPKNPGTGATFPGDPIVTSTPDECDPCLAIKALETIAAAQATQAAP